jgi:2-polyprenyl-3-methyl-5-hydroxy-6-metoxy-1,4-benzoquinol methylase
MSETERAQLRRSWTANAGAWRDAVREHKIRSRELATDAAIVAAIKSLRPNRVVDLGCGEGWLVRELSAHGIEAVGVDESAPLIESANDLGGGSFFALSYEELAGAEHLVVPPFDVAVANFSLLEEDIGHVLRATTRMLEKRGALIIQTVHPVFSGGDEPYESGARTETFADFEGAWPEPMPWYFRTLED